MSTPFRFASQPSSGSVAAGVTLLVSAWFALAAGAILNEPVAGIREVPAQVTVVANEARPETYETIHVVASRSQAAEAPQSRETIHVVASRSQALEAPQTRETIHVVASRSQPEVPQSRELIQVLAKRLPGHAVSL